MNLAWNAYTILILIAFLLAVIAIIKPQWPLAAVALLLVCVALLTKGPP